MDGTGAHEDLLQRLGQHSTGVSCLYLKNVEAIDLDVLEELVRRSYNTLTQGTYTKRVGEGGGPANDDR